MISVAAGAMDSECRASRLMFVELVMNLLRKT